MDYMHSLEQSQMSQYLVKGKKEVAQPVKKGKKRDEEDDDDDDFEDDDDDLEDDVNYGSIKPNPSVLVKKSTKKMIPGEDFARARPSIVKERRVSIAENHSPESRTKPIA